MSAPPLWWKPVMSQLKSDFESHGYGRVWETIREDTACAVRLGILPYEMNETEAFTRVYTFWLDMFAEWKQGKK